MSSIAPSASIPLVPLTSQFPTVVKLGVENDVAKGRFSMQENVETDENAVELNVFVHVLAAIFALEKGREDWLVRGGDAGL